MAVAKKHQDLTVIKKGLPAKAENSKQNLQPPLRVTTRRCGHSPLKMCTLLPQHTYSTWRDRFHFQILPPDDDLGYMPGKSFLLKELWMVCTQVKHLMSLGPTVGLVWHSIKSQVYPLRSLQNRLSDSLHPDTTTDSEHPNYCTSLKVKWSRVRGP